MSSKNFTTFEGKRKGSTYYCDGLYLYTKTVRKEDKVYLKCQVKTCGATAMVQGDVLTLNKYHSHGAPTRQSIEDTKRLSKVKEEAERTLDGPSTSQIYDAEVTWSETSSTARVEAKQQRSRCLAAMRKRRSRCRRRAQAL